MIVLPVSVTKYEPLADRSLKITLVTMREAAPEEVLQLANMFQQSIQCALKSGYIHDAELYEIPDISKKLLSSRKSLSERYRSVIYIYWKNAGGVDALGSFTDYYSRWMETQIEKVKELLPYIGEKNEQRT